MDLQEKIEKIRQKPEHVRMRYVWGGVVLGMSVAVIVWLFSLSESFRAVTEQNQDEQGALSDLKGQIDALAPLQDAAPSVEELFTQSLENIPRQEGEYGTAPVPQELTMPSDDAKAQDVSDTQNGVSGGGLPIAQ